MPKIVAKRLRVRKNKDSPWTDIPAAVVRETPQEPGVKFTPGNALELTDEKVLNVLTAHEPEPDNTLPITAAAVDTVVGNIEVLLKTI